MLKRETEYTYEYEKNKTVFVIESIRDPECREDMLDALIALMKRDIEKMGKS